LINQVEAYDGVPPLGESKYVDLHGPGLGAGIVLEEAGGLRGYGHVLPKLNSGVAELEVVLHPDARVSATVGDMVGAAVREAGNRPLLWWTFGEALHELAAAYGSLERRLHRVVGTLPPPGLPTFPGSIEVRGFQPEADEVAWLEVNNAAFAGHLEEGNWDLETLRDRQTRQWFDAEGLRMAWEGERLTGFCWTKIHPSGAGEIYVIAVHPEFQQRGLGRAIVTEGLWALHARGCSDSFLYVDAANGTALALYGELGFELDRVDRCWAVPKR